MKRLIFYYSIILLMFVFYDSYNCFSQSNIPSRNPQQVYYLLKKNNALDNYMFDVVNDVVNRLILAANNWKDYQINGKYKQDIINIYLFDSKSLPNSLILPIGQSNLDLSYVVNTGVADEESKIILIDTCLFKEYIASTYMHYYESTSFTNAVAMLKIYGLEKFEKLWNPSLNLSLTKKHEKLDYLFRGMIAFIIGHEMAHIYYGKKSYTKVLPNQFKGKDKYRQFVCSSILDKSYQERRELENKCDAYCVGLLSKILFPKDIFNNPYLWYELGAENFALYNLSCEIVTISIVIENKKMLYLAGLDNNLVEELSSLKRQKPKIIKAFFPPGHPSSYKRLSKTLTLLRHSKYSISHEKRYEPDPIADILDYTLKQQCKELQQKYKKKNEFKNHKKRDQSESELNREKERRKGLKGNADRSWASKTKTYSYPQTNPFQSFSGTYGKAKLDWLIAGNPHTAIINTFGNTGVVDVAFFDQKFGINLTVRQDLVLHYSQGNWFYVGSNPRYTHNGLIALNYSPDIFKLEPLNIGGWSIVAMCDTKFACAPVTTTPIR